MNRLAIAAAFFALTAAAHASPPGPANLGFRDLTIRSSRIVLGTVKHFNTEGHLKWAALEISRDIKGNPAANILALIDETILLVASADNANASFEAGGAAVVFLRIMPRPLFRRPLPKSLSEDMQRYGATRRLSPMASELSYIPVDLADPLDQEMIKTVQEVVDAYPDRKKQRALARRMIQSHHPVVSEGGAQLLKQTGSRLLDEDLRALKKTILDPGVSKTTRIWALEKYPHYVTTDESIAVFEGVLDKDPPADIRARIATTISFRKINSEPAFALLNELAIDKEESVREAARAALERLGQPHNDSVKKAGAALREQLQELPLGIPLPLR